jgi:DnaJ-domain-containing protein 1
MEERTNIPITFSFSLTLELSSLQIDQMRIDGQLILIVACFAVISVDGEQDFYELLGVSKSATPRDIRRAFKRLALEKHPDKRGV